MHKYLVNAAVQVVPVVQDRHPYEWVDRAIGVIRESGIKYTVGPFATILEGTYEEVMNCINAINNFLQKEGCAEWITNLQLQVRSGGDVTAEEKVKKYSAP